MHQPIQLPLLLAHTAPLVGVTERASQEQQRIDEAREVLRTLSMDAASEAGDTADLSVASAVRSRQNASLSQLVSFFVMSMALTFRSDLEASVHAFGLALLFVIANLLSSYVQVMARRLFNYRALARPRLAELAFFCLDNPVMFVGYVVMYILRANVVGPNDSVRLVDIIPVFVFFVLVEIELLYQDQNASLEHALHVDMRESLRATRRTGPVARQ